MKKFLLLISIGLFLTILLANDAIGQLVNGRIPFGGRILQIIPCANGKLLLVGPPKGGKFLFTAGSRLYMRYTLLIGRWVLGDAFPGAVCACPYGDCKLAPIPAQGRINQIGTN